MRVGRSSETLAYRSRPGDSTVESPTGSRYRAFTILHAWLSSAELLRGAEAGHQPAVKDDLHGSATEFPPEYQRIEKEDAGESEQRQRFLPPAQSPTSARPVRRAITELG